MTTFKKALAAIGTATAMLSAPASAIQLLIFDGADHLMYAVSSTGGGAPIDSGSQFLVNGTINGWTISITGATVDYSNPYSLQISGNMYRNSLIRNTDNLNTLIGTTDFSGGKAPNALGTTALNPWFTSISNPTPTNSSAADADTLKIRVADYLFGSRFPVNDVVGLTDNLALSSFVTNGSSTSMQVDYTNGAPTNIGVNTYNGAQLLNRTESRTFTQTNGTLIAGFDLTVAAGTTQGPATGFNLTDTITSFAVVPEPDSLALFGIALFGIGMMRRKKQA